MVPTSQLPWEQGMEQRQDLLPCFLGKHEENVGRELGD